MDSKANYAVSLQEQGFNCAQAVLAALIADDQLDAETALKIASPFGGGFGRTGGVCGAVTGALMALGVRRGSCVGDLDEKARVYEWTREFMDRFNAANGELNCRQLVGCEDGALDQLADAIARAHETQACQGFVRNAVEIAEQMLA